MTHKESLLPGFSLMGRPALKRFRDEMDDLFDNFVSNFFSDNWKLSLFDDIQPKSSFPKINVSEDDSTYTVDIAIAGFDKNDIKLILNDNALFIEANKQEQNEEEDKTYLRREISQRAFKRVVRFPEKISSDGAEASYDKGIISFNVKKDIDKEKDDSIVIEIK